MKKAVFNPKKKKKMSYERERERERERGERVGERKRENNLLTFLISPRTCTCSCP